MKSERLLERICGILFTLALVFCLYMSQAGAETNREDALQPIITTSELVIGTNRFAFGLLKSGKFFENADVILRLYAIDGQEAQHAGDATASYYPIEVSDL